MPVTHDTIRHSLQRALERYQTEVAASMARHTTFRRVLQEQCGREPGHLFAPVAFGSERYLQCSVCGMPRSAVAPGSDHPPLQTQEISS